MMNGRQNVAGNEEKHQMLDQALDFRTESDVFFTLLDSLEEPDWSRPTQFKDWTINDVLAHIHLGNYLADLSLQDSRAFLDFMRTFGRANKKAPAVWPPPTSGWTA